jgi:phosphoesterase RecJ-like protein
MLFIELKNGFKVSFRSKGKLPVNKLAGIFGGGGHQNASGARFRESKMTDMIPVILSEAEKFFNNYSKG